MSKLLTTTIVASKWACGGRKTQLVNKDGTMCCLGFDAAQRGITAERLLEEAAALPSDLTDAEGARVKKYAEDWNKDFSRELFDGEPESVRKLVAEYVDDSSGLEGLAVRINDSKRRISKSKRVELLRPVFKAAGRRIRFIDDEQPKQQQQRQ